MHISKSMTNELISLEIDYKKQIPIMNCISVDSDITEEEREELRLVDVEASALFESINEHKLAETEVNYDKWKVESVLE